MINPSYKQRLEVSKKVLYMSLGHEAVKLEAVKLWGCLIFFQLVARLEMGNVATKAVAYRTFRFRDVISILVFYGGLFSRQLRTENKSKKKIRTSPEESPEDMEHPQSLTASI